MKLGNGWSVEKWSLHSKQHSWRFSHDATDGEDGLYGHGSSEEDCKEQIIDIELEHPYFNEENSMTPPLTHITKPNVEAPKQTYKKRGRKVTTGTVKFPKSFSAPIETVTMLEELAERFSLETKEAPNNSATVCIAINELHAHVFGDDNEDRA